jgi:hypothetical protein
MTAWHNQWQWVACLLPCACVFLSCTKNKPAASAPPTSNALLAASPDAARFVPRRTNPIVVTQIVIEVPPSAAPVKTNNAPTITCGPVQTFPCSSADGVQAVVAVHVEDADGDALSVVWNADGKDRFTQQVPAGGPPTSTNLTFSYTFTPGDHGVKVTVSDGTVSTSCDTSVTVDKDKQPPVIVCPADLVVPVDPGQCTALVTFTPKASDNCPDVNVVCDPPSGTAFPIGATPVTCTATDVAGNVSRCGFTVAVQVGNRCPQNDAYWRQNPGAWPVNSLVLGNQIYTKSQLIALFYAPTTADASVALARQLMTAALNTAAGSDPRPICRQLAQAHSLLADFPGRLPYRVTLAQSSARPMFAAASMLGTFNSGMLSSNCLP